MRKVDSPVASRVGVTLILGALPLTPAVDASPSQADRCSRAKNPTKKIIYDNHSMTGIFVWDTKHCFEDRLAIGVWASLYQITTEGAAYPAGGGKVCKPNKPCRFKVTIDHAPVERSEYRFKFYDQATKGNGKRWDSGWMTCTSAVALASCDV